MQLSTNTLLVLFVSLIFYSSPSYFSSSSLIFFFFICDRYRLVVINPTTPKIINVIDQSTQHLTPHTTSHQVSFHHTSSHHTAPHATSHQVSFHHTLSHHTSHHTRHHTRSHFTTPHHIIPHHTRHHTRSHFIKHGTRRTGKQRSVRTGAYSTYYGTCNFVMKLCFLNLCLGIHICACEFI